MSLNTRLLRLFGDDTGLTAAWQRNPHELLSGLSPDQAIAQGEFLRVEAIVSAMERDRAQACGRRA